jgi:RNA polymerase sigma-70 factor (ECF subfamily)
VLDAALISRILLMHTSRGFSSSDLLHCSKIFSDSATPSVREDLQMVLTCQPILNSGAIGSFVDCLAGMPYDWRRVEAVQSAQLDPESFARLFEAARPALRVVAGSECGFEHADDVVQHGAVIALEQLNKFTPGTNFTAWAATIVRGVARNQRRSDQRRTKHQLGLAMFLLQRTRSESMKNRPTRMRPTGSTTEVEVPTEFDARLKDALSVLSTDQRACLLLKVLLEHSYSEISQILNIPPTTARSHVYRARLELMSVLDNPQMKGVTNV